MFERYTEKARRVVFFARYEASQFGASQIEAEHILLGLLREDHDLAARFFPTDAPDYLQIRELIEARIVPNRIVPNKIKANVDLPLSSEAKRVLGSAAQEADLLGSRHIGTEHLLLALLAEEGTIVFEILTGFGLRLDDVRKTIKDEVPSKSKSIFDRFIMKRTGQPNIVEEVQSARKYYFEEERWSHEVLKTCLDLGLITNSEFSSEFANVSALRNFSPDIEALLRLLVAKGLAEPQNLVVLALELRDEKKLEDFIEKIKGEHN